MDDKLTSRILHNPRVFASILDSLKKIQTGHVGGSKMFGICGFVMANRKYKTTERQLAGLMRKWPEYSGNPVYPVPAPTDDEFVRAYNLKIEKPDRYERGRYKMTPERFAYEWLPKWDNDEYGNTRQRLLNWLIETIEEALGEEK